MKRQLYLIALSFILSGCSVEGQETSSLANNAAENEALIATTEYGSFPETIEPSEESTDSDGDNYKENYPEWFSELAKSYQLACDSLNKGYSVSIGKSKPEKGSFNDSDIYSYYRINIDMGSAIPNATFQEVNSVLSHSYTISFTDHITTPEIRDVVTLTILALDPSIDLSAAEQLASQLSTSYTGNGSASDVLDCGDYYIFFLDGPTIGTLIGSEYPDLIAKYHKDVNQIPQNLSEYSEASQDILSSPLNKGLPIYVDATVENFIPQTKGFYTLLVKTEDNIPYKFILLFDNFCHRFQEGEHFRFYGIIAADQQIRLEYALKLYTESN